MITNTADKIEEPRNEITIIFYYWSDNQKMGEYNSWYRWY